MMTLVDRNNDKQFDALNANNLIDLRQLFMVELGTPSEYDNLQFFELDSTSADSFETGDYRLAVLAETPAGGAFVVDSDSREFVTFTADELANGTTPFVIGDVDFAVVRDED